MLQKNSKLVFTISIGFLIVAILLATWGFPKLVANQIQKNIQIENSSMMYEKFVKLPIPMDFKVYIFNVTNADEVNAGEKPKLVELGPYFYKEYREREILGYGDNDTIIYKIKKNFVFDAEASMGFREDDEITVINFSYMAAVLTIQELMPSAVGFVNKALEQFFTNLTDPFSRVKVKDLLFDGIFLNCDGNNSALGLVCGKIKMEMPSTMRKAEDGVNGFYFSMFSHMNRTLAGPYEIKRGTQNIYDLGQIVSYNNKTSMTVWGDEYCGQINGTDSTIYPPIDDSNIPEKLYSFEPDICRSLYVNRIRPDTLFNISVYYYEISELALAAKSANPDNKCFCKKNWSGNHDGCLIMGVLNLMPCQNAPVIVSLPHFFLGSDELLDFIADGIKPDKEKHNIYVYLDPITGVAVKGVKRLQFNIELRRIPNVPQLESVPTGLFPLLWVEEGAELPKSLQEELLNSHSLLTYVEVARWLILAVAIVVAVFATTIAARSSSMISWPKNSNSVSFILGPTIPHVNKTQRTQ